MAKDYDANMLFTKLFMLILQVHLSTCDVRMFVSPQGSDKNSGLSTGAPVQTINQAITNVQQSQYINATAYIELMPGYHDLDRTLYIRRNNTIIRSYKRQQVHVTGGRRIPSANIKPVTDKAIFSRLPVKARSHVRVVDLRDLNITNFGKMEKYGTGGRRSSPLEVFYNGQPLHLARWPNEGYLDMVSFPDGKSGLRFQYNSTVPRSWHNESDPWTYGYWFAGWTDGAVKVKSMDAATGIVTLAEKPPHGFRVTGQWQDFLQGKPGGDGGYFRFINILSELDEPGEYYMDRDSGKLYMWVPSHDGSVNSSDIIYISMIDDCIIIQPPTENVHLEDFTLEACRRSAVFANSVQKVKLYKMEIRNTGNIGLRFYGDTRDFQLTQCYIHDTCGGIYITGGDRHSLESSGNVIQNNEFAKYDRVGSVVNDAISVSGDGFIIKNNHIHNGQTGAINFLGNDNIIKSNLVHHVCMNTSSCNAMHIYFDWTFRGNTIENNIVHDVVKLVPGGGNKAVYLDIQISGMNIKNNVFYNNDIHVQIGGGRYNEVINNIMYNATYSSIYVDSRGTSHSSDKVLYDRLHAMPYNNSVWNLRYPHLAEIDKHNASLPEGNQISKNIIYAAPNTHYIKFGLASFLKANLSAYFNMTHTGFSSGRVDHVSVEKGDLRVTCRASEWANNINFRQVPSPNAVGPLSSPVGPTYLNRGRIHLVNSTHPSACPTLPPPKEKPVVSFIPDGSPGNHVYPVGKSGCWLNVTKCKNHTASVGTYRDMYGERYRYAADNETMCFLRALEQWKFCGSHKDETVVAIFGPTGNATIGGEGCVAAWYGCPKHGGPADGHLNTTNGRYFHDGSQRTPGQEGCLRRSLDIWRWCGASSNYPVTSIYLPTGAKRTAGGGCWIALEKCPAHTRTPRFFYDISGATYYQTDSSEFACLHRAEYYWHHCGSNPKYPVTATYRPTTASKTYP
ncbi:uncharacterized protein LOC128547283 [Mercenaria mercenaria]|uniref:uncharacterized protein LOC128547283 n=1 Tax=Mercenaria mercenaria TaxID=6596 RepID=UPI00234F7203|nr:uncharacterized protein LOC128547283 [Mercenaria mercenaria]